MKIQRAGENDIEGLDRLLRQVLGYIITGGRICSGPAQKNIRIGSSRRY